MSLVPKRTDRIRPDVCVSCVSFTVSEAVNGASRVSFCAKALGAATNTASAASASKAGRESMGIASWASPDAGAVLLISGGTARRRGGKGLQARAQTLRNEAFGAEAHRPGREAGVIEPGAVEGAEHVDRMGRRHVAERDAALEEHAELAEHAPDDRDLEAVAAAVADPHRLEEHDRAGRVGAGLERHWNVGGVDRDEHAGGREQHAVEYQDRLGLLERGVCDVAAQ